MLGVAFSAGEFLEDAASIGAAFSTCPDCNLFLIGIAFIGEISMRLSFGVLAIFVLSACHPGESLDGLRPDSRWVPLANGVPKSSISAVTIDPRNPSTIYVGAPVRGLFRSTDGGNSWERISTLKDEFVHHVEINPNNPSIIYVGALGTVYKSIDGGGHWREISQGLLRTRDTGIITCLTIDPRNPSTLCTSRHGEGIFKSINEGESWTAINDGLKELVIGEIVVDPADSSIVYASGNGGGVVKSVNGGIDWKPANKGMTNRSVLYLAIDQGTRNICACTLRGVFNSTDGGASWSADKSEFEEPRVGCPVTDPNNPQIMYTRTLGGMYQSTDGGKNWKAINNGLTSLLIDSMAIDSHNPANLYAGTTEGLFKLRTR